MESRAQPVWGQAGKWGAKPQDWEDEGGQCFSGLRKDRLTKNKRLGLQKRGMLAWKHRVQHHTAPKRWN